MNQLQLDALKTELVELMTPPYEEAYKASFTKNEILNHDFVHFVSYCHAYADHLLNVSALEMYGVFVGKFNDLMEMDEDYKHIENIQRKYMVFLATLSRNYQSVLIKDKRVRIRDHEFFKELDFEIVLINNLRDCYEDELLIERQRRVGYGVSDLLINRSIAVELKKGKARRMDVYQAFEYSFGIGVNEVCLIAKGFSEDVLEIAEKLGVICLQYDFLYEGTSVKPNGYPIGFDITTISKKQDSKISKIIKEVEGNIFYLSFYDPFFDFVDIYTSKVSDVKEVVSYTGRVLKNATLKQLNQFEQLGYDITSGLEGVLEQIK